MLKIITTGSRDWDNNIVIHAAITWAIVAFQPELDAIGGWLSKPILIKHGGCPTGADATVESFCRNAGRKTRVFLPDSADGAQRFRIRNQAMVDSGADVCLVFATKWASGSGMTARMCHNAGIPTFDFGVQTSGPNSYIRKLEAGE